ncbi:hypothetical protein RJI07_08580 [Mycoplasmatota bacterium WC30]
MKLDTKLYNMNFEIKREELNDERLQILLKYDCMMKITIDDSVIYDDWVCPLEMLKVIRSWEHKIKENDFVDFIYNSEDNDNNPIISFRYNALTSKWHFRSCFDKKKLIKGFTLIDIHLLFVDFKNQIYEHVKRTI